MPTHRTRHPGPRVHVHRVRQGGGAGVRVIRAAPASVRLALRDDRHWLSMYADREGAGLLVALWALAARSAHSLVYLPIRANPAPEGVAGDGEPVALDLVLLHHGLQFPTASWKEVRGRLGAGRPHTVSLPDRDFPDESAVDHDRWRHREYRDHLDFHLAAHTLFVVGSATAFRAHGAALRGLVDEAPSHRHRHPAGTHHCVELGSGPWPHARTRRHVPGRLHIQYCATWRV
ncbi:hypothetical protein [Streptomyces sp. NBC_00582]|uniref:hypothetical protein n=1 Tax=Streptomyces sp. NBC_00582 TaxID=2975783 RepID=UPI002E80A9AC|nr:hypothetical protein [Streptomyces sp. NBC_00582]WUB64022.1 hypothetical protein OG852_28310 [Streptomyces sp. NBC_00582]